MRVLIFTVDFFLWSIIFVFIIFIYFIIFLLRMKCIICRCA